ncbi:MAG: hypothetical protein IPK26_22085 [Planctomycetes bacterium]|nr:hypothetical protein [Planctomycetota bacterium]
MRGLDDLPWFHAALELLDLRRHERVLAIGCMAPQLRAIARLIGERGELTAIEPDRTRAEQLAGEPIPGLAVVAASPGADRFGSFDALLACPLVTPAWPWSELPAAAHNNLRPGGRFAIDVPAPDMIPVLRTAWAKTGRPPLQPDPLAGIADDRLAHELRAGGLRRVDTVLGTHLLTLESPFDLVELWTPALRLDDRTAAELGRALASELHSTGACDLLVHRTRVHGIR